jgi:serine/threonine protein kinase
MNIEAIDKYCFWDCVNLRHIEFAPHCRLKIIGDHAFAQTSLRRVAIPRNVEVIERHAFALCKELAAVVFESGSKIQSIAEEAFTGSIGLSAVVIPIPAKIDPSAFPSSCEITRSDAGPPLTAEDYDDQRPPYQKTREDWIISPDKYTFVRALENSRCIKLYREKEQHDPLLPRRVIAFKQYPLNTVTDEAFNQEIDSLILLDHPHIVPFEGFCLPTQSRGPVIATVYMPAGSLAHVLQTKPDWWNNKAKYTSIMNLVSGMSFAHGSNVIHRDLKPANLVFDLQHRLYICDFGTSMLMCTNASNKSRIGTPAYMAPEVYDGVAYSKQIDVYAFGLILYEIVMGRPVFPPDLPSQNIMKKLLIDDTRAEIPPTVAPWVRDLIQNCWQTDAASRPPFTTIERILQEHHFEILSDIDRPRDGA